MFSQRLSWDLDENELARSLARKREAGEPVWDLTESNPTRAGLSYPGADVLSSLASPGALVYEPSPFGLRTARDAVARYYRARGCELDAASIVLTASTSEAYGYLFKLLCDPGDEVLVPSPSYPLFAFLASLDGVVPRAYPLLADDDWRIDFAALEAALSPRTRAVIAVHPNNPTGSFVAPDDRTMLRELARDRELALIVDEVFLDYPLSETSTASTFAARTQDDGLVFVLGGLSKLAGLPQVKLSWMVVAGDAGLSKSAMVRLEHIADTYLSVGTPVQLAAPRLLELAPEMTARILARTRSNLAALSELAASEPSVSLLPVQGGWSAILRLAAVESSEAWALRFLEETSVYVHPGSYFGFAREAYVVTSLLGATDLFAEGVGKLLGVVSVRLARDTFPIE